MYIVLKEKKIHIPGDERSRTNPGHGYPAHWETFTEAFTFADKEDLIVWIKQQGSDKDFQVYEGNQMEVTRKVEVQLT